MKSLEFTDVVKNRINDYLIFLKEFDSRTNIIVQENPNFFSHRLHWDEHPFCYEIRKKFDINTLDGLQGALSSCLVFSFSNEHWGLIDNYWKKGTRVFDELKNTELCRKDLFQIYLKKDCSVKESLYIANDTGIKLSKRLYNRFKTRTYTIMELTRILDEFYKKKGFTKVKYALKNAARYLAMSFPELVDPNSPVTGGPGHFSGLSYIFNDDSISSPVDSFYSRLETGSFIPKNDWRATTWVNYMGILNGLTMDIFDRQHWLNNEDKVCFYYKLQQFKNEERKAKKNKNMDNIIPDWFKLKKI
jgi:hypothetical protein